MLIVNGLIGWLVIDCSMNWLIDWLIDCFFLAKSQRSRRQRSHPKPPLLPPADAGRLQFRHPTAAASSATAATTAPTTATATAAVSTSSQKQSHERLPYPDHLQLLPGLRVQSPLRPVWECRQSGRSFLTLQQLRTTFRVLGAVVRVALFDGVQSGIDRRRHGQSAHDSGSAWKWDTISPPHPWLTSFLDGP